jgi:hypothetical protein
MRLPLGKNHFPNKISHLERVSHRPENLLLQSSSHSNPLRVVTTKKLVMALVITTIHTGPEKIMGNNRKMARVQHGS